jgi:hypothetical protein
MNERIKQLWEECKTINWSYDNQTYDHEKFAELIVQECAGRVDWILAEGGGTQGDLIREHFGVEL